MSTTRSRWVTWTVGALVLVSLLGVAAVKWPYLLRHYRLQDLRANPELFEAYLFSEDSVRNAAASIFLEEDAGKRALFERYLNEYDNTEVELGVLKMFRRPATDDPDLKGGALAISHHSYIRLMYRGENFGKNQVSIGFGPKDLERRKAVLKLLDACEGETFRLAEFPDFEFHVQRVTWGKPQSPRWPGSPTDAAEPAPIQWIEHPSGLEHLCFFRVVR